MNWNDVTRVVTPFLRLPPIRFPSRFGLVETTQLTAGYVKIDRRLGHTDLFECLLYGASIITPDRANRDTNADTICRSNSRAQP
jgi:hypothetical protein